MSIRDDAAQGAKRTGPTSAITRLLAQLDGEERDDVIALIWDDLHISGMAAARALNKWYPQYGPFTDQQVRNHRNGERP